MTHKVDHLIIGSGIAGLMLAHKLGQKDKVTVIAKSKIIDNNTNYAQGGIASVLSPDDSYEKHIEDTMEAGADLCHRDIVSLVVRGGPKAIEELIQLGVDFTRDANADGKGYHLTREGGHQERRVIHAHDLTGKEVLRALIAAVRSNKNITILENHFAIDLITSDKFNPDFSVNSCFGAYVLDKGTNEVGAFLAKNTHLCTGGHGKLYLYTSNPDGATGDGLAMAWRAGCRVANLEFLQFHPTCLYNPNKKSFLISEAVRGEGAILKTIDGNEFMDKYHRLGSLAPRDVVARAIDAELKKSGAAHVYLDVRHLGEQSIKSHFPNIYRVCKENGIDMLTDMVPVVPAAHYSCGGVVVDEWARSDIERLFVLGETACTGLHGANRLASNSLLEALVFADRVTQYIEENGSKELPLDDVQPWQESSNEEQDELVVLNHTWDEIRRLMWNYVGIVRTNKRIERALKRIKFIREELNFYYWDYKVSPQLLELRNLADVAFLTVRCARKRKESRGIHYTMDFDVYNKENKAQDTILKS